MLVYLCLEQDKRHVERVEKGKESNKHIEYKTKTHCSHSIYEKGKRLLDTAEKPNLLS